MKYLYRLGLTALVVISASCVSGVSPEEAAQVYYNLGNAYQDLGKEQEAVRAYTRAWELNPRLFQAGYNLARLEIEAGRPAEARASLEHLLLQDESNTLLLELLAWSYVAEGEGAKARDIYENLLSLEPRHDRALYNLARLYENEERWADARQAYWRLYTLPSYAHVKDSPQEFLLRTSLLDLRLDDKTEAVKNLEYLREEYPDLRGLEALGRIYQEDRLFGRALEGYEDALDLPSQDLAEEKELRNQILREKAFILLSVVEDETQGMAALEDAVQAGGADYTYFERLLGLEDFLFFDQVSELRNREGIVPQEEGEEDPQADEEGGEESLLPTELPPPEG